MQLLAGTDVGTGVRGHVRVWGGGGDSAVQSHSMGGVRGGEEGHTHTHTHTGIHTHTHTQEHRGTCTWMLHLHVDVAPTLKRPIKSAREILRW